MRINLRTLLILACGMILMAILYHVLKSYFNISGRNADIATGITTWSICVYISSERILKGRLTVRDYFTIYNLSIVALVILGREAANILLALPDEFNFVVMLVIFMPLLALQSLTRRILFSNNEIEDSRLENSLSKKIEKDRKRSIINTTIGYVERISSNDALAAARGIG